MRGAYIHTKVGTRIHSGCVRGKIKRIKAIAYVYNYKRVRFDEKLKIVISTVMQPELDQVGDNNTVL